MRYRCTPGPCCFSQASASLSVPRTGASFLPPARTVLIILAVQILALDGNLAESQRERLSHRWPGSPRSCEPITGPVIRARSLCNLAPYSVVIIGGEFRVLTVRAKRNHGARALPRHRLIAS